MSTKIDNVIGRTVNHLTVEGPAGHNAYGHRLWWCRCTCGNRVQRTTNNFFRSYSCGCTHRRARKAPVPQTTRIPPHQPIPAMTGEAGKWGGAEAGRLVSGEEGKSGDTQQG